MARPCASLRTAIANSWRCPAQWWGTGGFTALAQEEHRPALYHCTHGKDRTGWAAASLVMLLGFSDDVLAEYLFTNDVLLPALQPIVDQIASVGGDREAPATGHPCPKEYLDAARDEMNARYRTSRAVLSTGSVSLWRSSPSSARRSWNRDERPDRGRRPAHADENMIELAKRGVTTPNIGAVLPDAALPNATPPTRLS